MELTEVIKEKVRDEGFDAYMEGAARMMTVVALMRSIGSIDAEEAEDMLERLSALVMRGANALGRKSRVDLTEFMRGLMELHERSVGAADGQLAVLAELQSLSD
jgi:hypothetical protein